MKPRKPKKFRWSVSDVRHLAFFDGEEYQCDDCFDVRYRSEVYEIDRIYSLDGRRYTPVLRCGECGALYWGMDEYDYSNFTPKKNEPDRQGSPTPKETSPKTPSPKTPKETSPKNEDIILPDLFTV